MYIPSTMIAYRSSPPWLALRILLASAVALAIVTPRAVACSQCLCGSPTPPGYLLGAATDRFDFGIEDRYLAKTNALADSPGEEQQNEHRLGGLAMWRTGHLSLQARLPYVWKELTEVPAGEMEATSRSHGLGDADALARWDAMRRGSFANQTRLGLVAGASIPTGSNDLRDAAGNRLEQHLQTGTGAWSGTFGLAGDALRPGSALSASVLGRLNGTNTHGYHYGNALLYNAGWARTLGPTWQASLELNGRTAERDRTEDGTSDPHSGGTVLYASPGVRWLTTSRVALDLLVQIPVAQALYGVQHEKTTARFAVTFVGGR